MIRLNPFRTELTRRIARNAVFSLIGRVWYVVLWLLVTPHVLRVLGPERFGVWSVLFLLSGYLTTFDLGIGASLVKFTADHVTLSDWVRLRNISAHALRVYTVLGAAWILAVILLQPWLLHWLRISPEHVSEVRAVLIASAVVFAFANLVGTGSGLLTGLQRMDVSNAILVGASIPQMVVLLAGLAAGYGLYAVVAGTLVQWLVTFVAAWIALGRLAPQIAWPNWRGGSGGSGWWKFGIAVQANGLLAITQQQIDKLILTTLAGVRTVTEFELGFRVANAVQSIPMLLLGPLLPAFAELHTSGDHARLRHLSVRSTRWMALAAFGLAAGAVPASPTLVHAWVGEGHGIAEFLAPWLLAGLAVSLTTGVATVVARSAGRPDLELGPGVIAVVAHALLGWSLIRAYGPAGAGPAFFLAMIVWAAAYLVRFTRWSPLSASDTFGVQIAPLAAGIAGVAAGWQARLAWSARSAPTRWGSAEASAIAFAVGTLGFLALVAILDRRWLRRRA